MVNNVFFNSPRSLVNYNDAFRGGDLMLGNVMWGAVKETADHASFNSWDRQAFFWEGADGVPRVKPEMQLIQKNLILNKDYQYGSTNSDWAIDHDDASSWFEDSNNVMVYGSHKWRDGVHKWYTDNLCKELARALFIYIYIFLFFSFGTCVSNSLLAKSTGIVSFASAHGFAHHPP